MNIYCLVLHSLVNNGKYKCQYDHLFGVFDNKKMAETAKSKLSKKFDLDSNQFVHSYGWEIKKNHLNKTNHNSII